jgi:hypothetical protein
MGHSQGHVAAGLRHTKSRGRWPKAVLHNPLPSEPRKIEKSRVSLVLRTKTWSWQGLGQRIVKSCFKARLLAHACIAGDSMSHYKGPDDCRCAQIGCPKRVHPMAIS